MIVRRTPKQNQLLAALPAATYALLEPRLELATLPRGWAICEPGTTLDYAYFPTSSIVSVLTLLPDGVAPEVAVIGFDGVVGISTVLGAGTMSNSRSVVQSAGHGFRIAMGALQETMERDAACRNLIVRYALSLFAQTAQTVACNRYHRVDQQVCRLLLMCLDRWASNRLSLTHERMANLLGVRREGVTEASRNLAAAGLISYVRGCVTILDRPGLEARVCDCYRAVRTEAERLLPAMVPQGDPARGVRSALLHAR